jgi:hypothetical protein
VTLRGNRAAASGGGVLLSPTSASLTLVGCTLAHNAAGSSGDQLEMLSTGGLTFTNITVLMNTDDTRGQVGAACGFVPASLLLVLMLRPVLLPSVLELVVFAAIGTAVAAICCISRGSSSRAAPAHV